MNDLMSAIRIPSDGLVVDTIGWLLLHSVWQFAFIGAAIFVVLGTLRKSSARVRYRVLLAAMLMIVVTPVLTSFWMMQDVGRSHSIWSSKEAAIADDSSGQDITQKNPKSVTPTHQVSLENPASISGIAPSTPTQSGAAFIEPIPQSTTAQPTAAQAETSSTPWYQQGTEVLGPWLPVIVFVWMLGILVCAIRPLFGWLIVVRLRRAGTTAVPENIQTLFENTLQRMHVKPIVSVWQSSLIQIPVVVGYFKPVILLPVSVMTELPVKQIEAILAHELAHVKRFDYVVNILQTVVETVFFYHPAVWWLSRQIRIEREHCCDDDVVRILDNRRDYGQALLAMTEMKSRGGVLAVGAGGSSLLARVRRLCGIEPMQRSWSKFIACSLVLLIGAGLLGFPWRAIADEEGKNEFDIVTIKLVGDTGNNESHNYRIDVPHVGYPGVGKVHQTLLPNEDGVFSVKDFASGLHSLMVTDAAAIGYWKHSFTLELPNPKQHIDIPTASFAGVPKADPDKPQPIRIEKLNVCDGDWDIRCKIVAGVLNNGSKPWPIGDFSDGVLELVGNEYRVFVPKGMIQPQGEIASGRTFYAQIDWPKLVSEGLWLRRDNKDTTEALLPDDELHLGFRMSLWGQATEPFQLPHPKTILADFAAMEKAKTRLEFARPSYFVGEHMPANYICLLYTSPSPRDRTRYRMPSSA